MNYARTLIAVADDCPVTRSAAPLERIGKPTVAAIQHAMIASGAYLYTQEDVLFQSWLLRQDRQSARPEAEIARLRAAFFAKPQPCLRSSPLPKKYGWGLLFNEHARVALCPMESAEYRHIVAGEIEGVQILKALRSKRA